MAESPASPPAPITAFAPFGALLLVVAAGIAAASGNASFPWWALAGASALLAVCSVGVVAAHGEPAPVRLAMAGWAAAFGFATIGVALAATALTDGSESTNPLAALPVLLGGTGIVTVPIASGMLAVATRRAGRLATWGPSALWVATPTVPLAAVAAARSSTLIARILDLVLAGAWVAVGLAERADGQ